MKKPRWRGYRWIVGFCILLMFLLSCESKDKYVGVYKAEGKEPAKQGDVILELKANGEGLWKVGSKEVFSEVSFAWYLRRGELRMNTKGGGVLVGKIEKDTIHLILPGPKAMTFKKIQ
jgi:hypothetical protein